MCKPQCPFSCAITNVYIYVLCLSTIYVKCLSTVYVKLLLCVVFDYFSLQETKGAISQQKASKCSSAATSRS
jgi:hypothetical protein